MGITRESLKFLYHCKEHGVDFESTCQIGRQCCFFSCNECGIKYCDFAEPLFRFLGAKSVDSIDYSDYEGASIIHDMNQPISDEMKSKYSLVIDCGTLEHVFDYPTAIKNCMQMVKQGGHFIAVTPANNFFGHGFYQFSPELFYSLLSEQNSFTETQILTQDDLLRWYKIREPKTVKGRVNVSCAKNTTCSLYVVSKKISDVPDKLTVLQSDYIETWTWNEKNIQAEITKVSIKKFIKKIIPERIINNLKEYRKVIFAERVEGRKIVTVGKKRFYERIKLKGMKV